MYRLQVFNGSGTPMETVMLARAAEVLERIPQLLSKHTDCERVEVTLNATKLFTVDCKGNLLPE